MSEIPPMIKINLMMIKC